MFNENLVRIVQQSSDLSYRSKLDEKRGVLFKEGLKLTGGNVLATLRLLFLSDQELMDEVAYLQERKGSKVLRKVYNRFAKTNGEGQNTFSRAAAIDADAGNGDVDFGTLFVEGVIKKRVEEESELLNYCDVKQLNAKSGKFPKSSNVAKAAFATVSADLTDLTDTIDDGFDNTAVEAEKFGGTMFLEAEAFVKLTAQTISQILDELTLAYVRGLHDQIVNGNGTPPNALGFAANATAITFGTNVSSTLIKMIAAVADASKGGSKDIFILTNTAGKMTMVGEKFINPAYNDLLDLMSANLAIDFLKQLPVVEDNMAIVTSGSSPNKAAALYVGKKGDYLVAMQTTPEVMIDKYSDFKAGGETARIMNFWTGKPHYNDSFAKTTIPTIY